MTTILLSLLLLLGGAIYDEGPSPTGEPVPTENPDDSKDGDVAVEQLFYSPSFDVYKKSVFVKKEPNKLIAQSKDGDVMRCSELV